MNRGELVTLLGRNGAGRTTTLQGDPGAGRPRAPGPITFNGRETIGMPPHRIARLGIGYCPEERGIFASLSAEENLLLPPQVAQRRHVASTRSTRCFPICRSARHSPGTRLSGGEQQMLAMARILRTGARLLLLDEITEGLAPVIVQKLGEVIREAERGASPSCWSSRTSASPRRWPTAST